MKHGFETSVRESVIEVVLSATERQRLWCMFGMRNVLDVSPTTCVPGSHCPPTSFWLSVKVQAPLLSSHC